MKKIAQFLFTSGSPRRISPPMNKDFKKNTEWDKTDQTYYGSSTNDNGTIIYHYTEAYLEKKNKNKFLNNTKVGNEISRIRRLLKEDLKSKDEKTRMMALMVTLVDQAYFRIGNSKSEKEDIRGLHNLQDKHITINSDIHFKYRGKDKIIQHQIIVDEKIKFILKKLLANKKPNDYIFTFKDDGEDKIITPDMINDYLKNDLDCPVTIHKFRTYHATRLAKEELDKIKVGDKKESSEIIDEFNEAMDRVAEKLGHTTCNTTIKHYIDHEILDEFFKKHKVRPPKSIKN